MKRPLLLLGLLLFLALSASAQNTHFFFAVNGVSTGPHKVTVADTILAGSAYTLLLTINPTEVDMLQEYHGLPMECPSWLSIGFSEIKDDSAVVPLSKELLQELALTYYIRRFTLVEDSLYKESYDAKRKSVGLLYPDYEFYFEVPQELTGKTLKINPVFDPPPYGPIAIDPLFDQREVYVYVKSPVTKEDATRMLQSKADNLMTSHQYEACMTFADSAIQHGWYAVAEPAMSAAREMGSFDKAIAYLDTMYEKFGTISLIRRGWMAQVDNDSMYFKLRQVLMDQQK